MIKSIKLFLLAALVIVMGFLGSACSSNQEAIDAAVQQTVEAQSGGATEDTDEDTTGHEAPSPATDVSESEAELMEVTANPNAALLGVWEGQLEVPGFSLNSTYAYEQFTFYDEILVLRGEDGSEEAFLYTATSPQTMALTAITGDEIGELHWEQSETTSLMLELTYAAEPDNIFISSQLQKVANIPPGETIVSLSEAVLGGWDGYIREESVQLDFIAGIMAFSEWGQLSSPFIYTFTDSDRLIVSEPWDDDNDSFALRMTDVDTLFLWNLDEIENPDGGVDVYAEFIGVFKRLSTGVTPVPRPADQQLYPFYNDELRCGYIDKDGAVAIPPMFAACGDFYEGRARVAPFSFDGDPGNPFDLWGYIDNSGQFVIPAHFASAGNFNEGVARVRDYAFDENTGYINTEGEYLVEPKYDNGNNFSDGLAHVQINEPPWAGFIDIRGEIVFEAPNSIDHLGLEFSDGLLELNDDYLDKTGQIVIDLTEGSAQPFSEGLAAVILSNLDMCLYISPDEALAFTAEYDYCGNFSEGLAVVYDSDSNRCGYINTTGELTISLQYENCGNFSEDRAVVTVGDTRGYINRQGQTIFAPRVLGFAQPFHGGLARIGNGYNWGYIDQEGNIVLAP